ncbi:MAG: hypothetical protein H8E37_10090 [Planctomycetes bacterium]|nr:hypothetical protein [Planctomycetota bacterium]
MKSAIFFALAIVPALTGFLTAADPLDAPATAFAPVENSPPPARARLKKPAGPPIGLIIRVYEMDTEKLKESIDFNPMKEDRKTVNGQFEEFRKAGLVKLIAEPHLVTQDGRQATMLAGGEVPVYVPASKDSVAIDFIEFGTRVEVTPRQLKQDRVQIKIAVEFTRRSARGLTVENVKEGTNPVIVGRMIRAVTTLGPKDIIVLNDSEAREEDEPRKVNFMTIELADLGVEEALLQFDEEAQDVIQPPPVVPEQPTRVDVNDLPLETAPSKAGYDLFEEKPLPAPRTPKKTPTPTAPKNSFYLKPGKTQLEIVRGTWQSLTIPSKDFGFGSSLLVESPEEGAISISGRILTPWEERPAKSETFEAGGSGGKYAADIWTIKGVKPGIATIRLIDDHDQEYEIEVTVKGDTRHFDAMVKRFHPKAKVEAHELTEDSVVITGEATPEDVIAIQEIAQQLYSQVLLRLKTQRVPLNHDFPAALEGTLNETGADYSEPLRPTIETPGEIDSDAPANTFPKSSEVGSSNYPVRISDTNDDPALSTPIGVDTPQPANGFAPENQVGADADPGPVHPEGFDEFVGLEPAKVANAVVGYRKSSKPPVATTQVRFLSDGLISMQSPTEPGAFQRVQSWVDWSTWKYIGGQRQQVRYRTHRETLPQGSRTPFQFQTTEFRNDVWVNGLLLTAIGNDRTHYRLQHFPVDLVLERHEIEAAARGQLVTRIVVMKEDRPSVLTEEGKSVEPREAFTVPDSVADSIA